jgi:ribosomal protein L11 methyltransferase
VTVPLAQEDAAVALLWEAGSTGLQVLDPASGRAVLLAYFPASSEIEVEVRATMRSLAGARVEAVAVPEVDWVQRFREGFQPFACGAFWVSPAWRLDAPPRGLTPLVVDPARAFGTGTHETTRLCLRAIERASPPPRADARMLDVGTGTGILSVAAALLGWRRVAAVDCDPDAVASARRHALLNEIRLDLVAGDGARPFAPSVFDLVVANLTAPLLLERRDELLAAASARRATVVLSGFLESDLSTLSGSYAAAGDAQVDVEGEWACIALRVRP